MELQTILYKTILLGVKGGSKAGDPFRKEVSRDMVMSIDSRIVAKLLYADLDGRHSGIEER